MRVFRGKKSEVSPDERARYRIGLTSAIRVVLVATILFGAVVNVMQFREPSNGISYGALLRWPSESVLRNLNKELNQTNAVYFSLAEVAPRAHLVASSTGGLVIREFLNKSLTFGGASGVEYGTYAERMDAVPGAQAVTGLPVGSHVESTGVFSLGQWKIVTGSCAVVDVPDGSSEFAVLQVKEKQLLTVFLIETCLLPKDTVKAL